MDICYIGNTPITENDKRCIEMYKKILLQLKRYFTDHSSTSKKIKSLKISTPDMNCALKEIFNRIDDEALKFMKYCIENNIPRQIQYVIDVKKNIQTNLSMSVTFMETNDNLLVNYNGAVYKSIIAILDTSNGINFVKQIQDNLKNNFVQFGEQLYYDSTYIEIFSYSQYYKQIIGQLYSKQTNENTIAFSSSFFTMQIAKDSTYGIYITDKMVKLFDYIYNNGIYYVNLY